MSIVYSGEARRIIFILRGGFIRVPDAFHASLEGPVRNDRLPSPEEIKDLLVTAGFNVLSAAELDDLYWIEAERMEET